MEGPCFCLNPPQTQGLMFILVRVYVHEKKTLLAVGATKLWMAGAPLLFSEAGRGCGVRYFCWAGGWGLPRGGLTHPGGEGKGPGTGWKSPPAGRRGLGLVEGPCSHLLLLVSSDNPATLYPREGRRRETAPPSRSRSWGLPWGSAGRIRLPTQGTRVQAPVEEGPIRRGAARPARHDCGSLRPKTRAPQPETSPQREARGRQLESSLGFRH